jgi:hypothetical protein
MIVHAQNARHLRLFRPLATGVSRWKTISFHGNSRLVSFFQTFVHQLVPSIGVLSADILVDTNNAEWRLKTVAGKAKKFKPTDSALIALVG